MIELLLASGLQLPQVNGKVVRHVARRAAVDNAEQTAAARVALWIDPKGKVLSCDLVDFEGNENSANRLCRAIVGTRFTSAKGANDDPVHSLYVTDLTAYPPDDRWQVKQMQDNLQGSPGNTDIVLSMATMPDDFFWKSTHTVAVMIDNDGRMTHCETDGLPAQPWVSVACGKAKAIVFEPLLSQQGVPVPYIRNISVRYESKDQ